MVSAASGEKFCNCAIRFTTSICNSLGNLERIGEAYCGSRWATINAMVCGCSFSRRAASCLGSAFCNQSSLPAPLFFIWVTFRASLFRSPRQTLFSAAGSYSRPHPESRIDGRGLLLIFLKYLLREFRRDRVERCELGCDLLHVRRRKLATDDGRRFLTHTVRRIAAFRVPVKQIWRALRSLRSLTQPGLHQAPGHRGLALCL